MVPGPRPVVGQRFILFYSRARNYENKKDPERVWLQALAWWGLAGSNRRPPACERLYIDIIRYYILHTVLFVPKSLFQIIFSPLFPFIPNLSMVSRVVVKTLRITVKFPNRKTVFINSQTVKHTSFQELNKQTDYSDCR